MSNDKLARYPHPDEDDAVTLWAEIHRLRAALQGPEGYATWQEAAVAERVRRVRAEKALAEKQAGPVASSDKEDAERYRWLRKQDDDDFCFAVVKNPHFDVYGSPEELDAAIDAARAKEQQ